MLILLFSSLVWSIGSLYSRRARNAASPFLSSAQTMLCGGSLMMIAGFARGEAQGFDPRQVTALSLGAFVYLVLVGAIVGYTAFIWLLRHCDPSKVATYAYVNPVVAVLLGALFRRRNPDRPDGPGCGDHHRLRRPRHHRSADETKNHARPCDHSCTSEVKTANKAPAE